MAPDFPDSGSLAKRCNIELIQALIRSGDPERVVVIMSVLQTWLCFCACAILSQLVQLPLSFLPFRNPGEDTKMLVCDMCDKGYHTFCLQPAMDSLPTNGWRCKVGKDESLLGATASELPHSRERETVKCISPREPSHVFK